MSQAHKSRLLDSVIMTLQMYKGSFSHEIAVDGICIALRVGLYACDLRGRVDARGSTSQQVISVRGTTTLAQSTLQD